MEKQALPDDPAEVTITIKIGDLVVHAAAATIEFDGDHKLRIVADEETKAVMAFLNERFKFRQTAITEAPDPDPHAHVGVFP